MSDVAWMLRQDGSAFPVKVHLYCMGDHDFSSEAECAAFIMKTQSDDLDLAKYVLDCWMAMLVVNAEVTFLDDNMDIESILSDELDSLPYHFAYPLSKSQLLDIHMKGHNFWDLDSLRNFIHRMNEEEIQHNINTSINQQFCRVRYGGEYNTDASNNEIWCRVSSVGYNWANTIYKFVASIYRSYHISKITVCRDFESDNGEFGGSEYFYTAKDGQPYHHMPIEEYLAEEHEHSVVFNSTPIGAGVYRKMKSLLSKGYTCYEIAASGLAAGQKVDGKIWNWFVRQEQGKCIHASQFLDSAPVRTRAKLGRVMQRIRATFPEISSIDIDSEPKENNAGNLVGIYYMFELTSDSVKVINGKEIRLGYNKAVVPEDIIFRDFKLEYSRWKSNMLKRGAFV